MASEWRRNNQSAMKRRIEMSTKHSLNPARVK